MTKKQPTKKSDHKHQWVRVLKYTEKPNWPYRYDLMLTCTVCNRVKPAPYRDRIVRVGGRFQYLLTYEELIGYYGDLEVLKE